MSEKIEMKNLIDSFPPKPLKIGEKISGIFIGKDRRKKYLIDYGTKTAVIILGNRKGDLPQFGDLLEGEYIGDLNGEIYISEKVLEDKENKTLIRENMEDRTLIKIRIKDSNFGGLVGEYLGQKVFLPTSQLNPEYYPRVQNLQNGIEDQKNSLKEQLNQHVGKDIDVLLIKEQEEIFIVSQKELYREERKIKLEELKLKKGKNEKIKVKVTGYAKFGVFVTYNGLLHGLIHKSEISEKFVEDPKNHFQIGLEYEAFIKDIKENSISFSTKGLIEI